MTALDLGSSTIRAAIAKPDRDGMLTALGYGDAPSEGLRHGAVVDLEAGARAIATALSNAQAEAGCQPGPVWLAVSGGHVRSHLAVGRTALPEAAVGPRDLRRCLDDAYAASDDPQRARLHATPTAWTVDDYRGVRDPRGMFGAQLEVEVGVVDAALGPVRNMIAAVERAGVSVRGVVAAPIAAAEAVASSDDRALGARVIVMGGGVTAGVAFADGVITHAATVPVGGEHVTKDVARGLSLSLEDAEHAKRLDGAAAASGGANARAQALAGVIGPRVEEMFELIRARLIAAGAGEGPTPVVLTGAGASLPGVTSVAEKVFGARARLGAPDEDAFADRDEGLALATLEGVLLLAESGANDAAPARRARRSPRPVAAPVEARGGLARAAAWLRENF